jgi:hypothetical protein
MWLSHCPSQTHSQGKGPHRHQGVFGSIFLVVQEFEFRAS